MAQRVLTRLVPFVQRAVGIEAADEVTKMNHDWAILFGGHFPYRVETGVVGLGAHRARVYMKIDDWKPSPGDDRARKA